jgi:hypothetical protein
MKTRQLWIAIGILLSVLTGAPAHAQDPSFTLVNNTGFTVYSVHYWPVTSSSRGSDRLGRNTISSGDTHDFYPDDEACVYNVRVALEGRNEERQWNDINLCRLVTLTLNYNYLIQDLWVSRELPGG